MKSCLWPKFKVLKRCSNKLKGQILSASFLSTQRNWNFSTFLIKFAKYFIWFVMRWWKRALCWSPGVCWGGRGWTEGLEIKWRRKLRPPATFRRYEGLSRFQWSASVPWATREAMWGPTYLVPQRMSCVFHTRAHTQDPEVFLFVRGHMFLSPSLQILVCWQYAGFLRVKSFNPHLFPSGW